LALRDGCTTNAVLIRHLNLCNACAKARPVWRLHLFTAWLAQVRPRKRARGGGSGRKAVLSSAFSFFFGFDEWEGEAERPGGDPDIGYRV